MHSYGRVSSELSAPCISLGMLICTYIIVGLICKNDHQIFHTSIHLKNKLYLTSQLKCSSNTVYSNIAVILNKMKAYEIVTPVENFKKFSPNTENMDALTQICCSNEDSIVQWINLHRISFKSLREREVMQDEKTHHSLWSFHPTLLPFLFDW